MALTPSRPPRWPALLWLIASQAIGAAFLFPAAVILLTFLAMSTGVGEDVPITWLGLLGPLAFLGLAIAAWVAVIARRLRSAALLSGLALFVGVGVAAAFFLFRA